MKISEVTPNKTTLKELGRRLAQLRKQRRLNQEEMAKEAGLGVATVRRIETGQDAQFSSWIKMFKVLGLTPALDVLLPEEINSPMAEVTKVRKQSKIAARSAGSRGQYTWGDHKS